jgi:DNA-binding CsgD family transcriptional regulator
MTNHELLRSMAEIAAEVIGIEVTGLGVFEQGIMRPATACHVVGPWSADAAESLVNPSRWSENERVLAMKLTSIEPNRVYRRAELLQAAAAANGIAVELPTPMLVADEALGLFRRTDGAELLLALASLDSGAALPELALEKARAIAPFLASCWASAWKVEPAWARQLRPSSRSVLDLVISGLDDDQIADRTGLTYHSVRAHLKRLFKDAGVRSRLHLMQEYRSCTAGCHDLASVG